MILSKNNCSIMSGDPKVWDAICSGDTEFMFQFGSPGMRNIITQTKPRSIDALAEINALWRPGPIEAGFVEKYIAIKTGQDPKFTEEEQIISDVFKRVFGENHTGLAIFQEDVMRLCQECCDFNMTEADDIRRAMGKKDEKVLLAWHDPFVQRWKMGGDPEKVWQALVGFAHYAFNKSHSVAYADIGYETERLWVYHKYEMLEYMLNDGTKEDHIKALDKCKVLGMKMDHLDLARIGTSGNRYWIEETNGAPILHIPIELNLPEGAELPKTYVGLLFDPEYNWTNLILDGVCDHLCEDRYALADLHTLVPKRFKSQALYMEPEGVEYKRLDDILEGLKIVGGLESIEKNSMGDFRVMVKKVNNRPSVPLIIHANGSDVCRARRVFYDLKRFGSMRNGLLSRLPDVQHDSVVRALNQIKEKVEARGGDSKKVYSMMYNYLEDHMHEYHSTDRNTMFYGVYALFKDKEVTSRNTKIYLEFEDKKDLFYVNGSLAKIAERIPANTLVKLDMRYSPFISRRKLEYVYDFDILKMEAIDVQM